MDGETLEISKCYRDINETQGLKRQNAAMASRDEKNHVKKPYPNSIRLLSKFDTMFLISAKLETLISQA